MTASASAWEAGRLDGGSGARQVLFGRMYEDASIEASVFRPGGRILCIASAGCTAMALADHHDVVAVDINPVQLGYAERRFAGDPGFRGQAERIMDGMRFFAPLAGWRPSRVRAFLELGDPEQQIEVWRRELDTRRFRLAFDALFSMLALRRLYGSRFLDFLPSRFGRVMRQRMERCFARHPNRSNPYAWALLMGVWSDEPTPRQVTGVRLVHADAAGFLENEPPGSFDGFSLSNILDGADDSYRQRLFAATARAGTPDAVTVLRSFSDDDVHSTSNRAADDRSLLWGSVLVRRGAV